MVTTDSPGTVFQCRGCLCVDDATQLETGKEDAAIEGQRSGTSGRTEDGTILHTPEAEYRTNVDKS